MICSKCNCEIPDNAKFCANCGAAVSAPANDKKFCENCGLELPKGARFCAVCGAAVNGGSAPEVKPADVLAPVTLGAPVSADLSSEKTAELAENHVSEVVPAENVESGYPIPVPTSDVSMPAIDKTEAAPAPVSKEPWGNEGELLWQASEKKSAVPEPAVLESSDIGFIPESNYTEPAPTATGYSAAAISNSAPMPENNAPVSAPTYSAPVYTAPQVNPNGDPYMDYQAGAAAVAVKPIKKKNIAKRILIPVLAVIGAALIAAGVIFFVNRSLFFSIILGKSGYAAMVEGNSIRSVTDKIDMAALSDGIKQATTTSAGSYSSLFTGASRNSDIAPMMSYSGSAGSMASSIDLKKLVSSLNETFLEAYGANSVKITTDINAELTDTFKAQIAGMLNCSESQINEIIAQINDVKFAGDITAAENAYEVGFEVTAAGLKLNAKSVIAEDGKVYLMLPFASDKAFMINVGTASAEQAGQVKNVYLELDEKELKRITDKLVNVYLEVYKSCEITSESGEITAAGVTAKGEHITVNLTGTKLTELIRKIADTIMNDSYFCGKLSTFMSECGFDIPESQLKNTVTGIVNMITIPDGAGIVIETITDNSCRVLAKSYSVLSSGKTTGKASFVGDLSLSTKNGNSAGIEVKLEDKTFFDVSWTKASDFEGSFIISSYVDDNKISVMVKYSNITEATFCGKKINTGDFEISLQTPVDFTGSNEQMGQILPIISSAKISLSVRTDGENKMVETITLDIPQYGKLTANVSAVVENNSAGVSVPSDCIDITDIGELSADEIPEELKKEVIAYLRDVKNAIKGQNAGELGDGLASALDAIISIAENGPAADAYDVSNFLESLTEQIQEVRNFDDTYNNEDEALSEKAKALANKMASLMMNASRKASNMTKKEFDAFRESFTEYVAEADALRDEYIAASQGVPVGGKLTKADSVDFTTLDFQSLSAILIEYESRYASALRTANGMTMPSADVQSALAAAQTEYETVSEDYENLYDVYCTGSLNLSLLRKCRKSARTFAYAVEALEEAVASTI